MGNTTELQNNNRIARAQAGRVPHRRETSLRPTWRLPDSSRPVQPRHRYRVRTNREGIKRPVAYGSQDSNSRLSVAEHEGSGTKQKTRLQNCKSLQLLP